jgi:hypothetical protein
MQLLWGQKGDVLVPQPGIDPPSTTTLQIGGTVSTQAQSALKPSGNLPSTIVSRAGVSPAATAADVIVAIITLPASAFDQAGRGFNLLAMGSFANNVNVKRCKIIANPITS